MWAGYDIVGVDDDLSAFGLTRVDDWPEEELSRYGIAAFARVEPDDEETYGKLGISHRNDERR